ncbi:hypothetical protein MNB_SM-7-198 [hydrothermal vent metagenome]|uniref:AB hydrolase-1 domain-containing protein n=1 Tax=hydrothermal vent metagenome TaxID=652676 RepID=A0A1W1C055_9ZZZZ
MRFYSGFALKNEEHFFAELIQRSEFSIYGFSYGAIKAYKEAIECVKDFKRVDRVVLLSPAFFQTKSEAFKKLQLRGYNKDKKSYLENFLSACFAPYKKESVFTRETTSKELEELLYFEWNRDELVWLQEQGVIIEVYIGGKDHIIDAKGAYEFFKDIANVTLFKNANHFLQGA